MGHGAGRYVAISQRPGGLCNKEELIIDAFAACPIPPIVVVSLEAGCNGEVLKAVFVILLCATSFPIPNNPYLLL